MPRPRLSLLRTAVSAAVILVTATVASSQTPGPRPTAVSPSGAAGLWISESPLDEGRRLLVVIDAATRRAAVYHLDVASGSLTLKSARDLSWDLSLDEFNVQEPRPAALRKMLQSAPVPAP